MAKNVKARKESDATDVKLKGIKECSVSIEKLDMKKEAGNLNSSGFLTKLIVFILNKPEKARLRTFRKAFPLTSPFTDLKILT